MEHHLAKVILLGSNGLVGSRLLSNLLQDGHEVFAFSKSETHQEARPNFYFQKIDLISESISNLFANFKADYLFHCAWITTPGICFESEENYSWLETSKNLINQFELNGGLKSIILGSCAEYTWNKEQGLTEESETQPKSLYGKQKLELVKWLASRGSNHLWLRTFFQFGGFETGEKMIPGLIDAAIQKRGFKVNAPNEYRDFVYVEDVAKASYELFKKDATGIFNLGSGQGQKIEEVAKLVYRMALGGGNIDINETNDSKVRVVADNSKFSDFLPNFFWTDFNEALHETIQLRTRLMGRIV